MSVRAMDMKSQIPETVQIVEVGPRDGLQNEGRTSISERPLGRLRAPSWASLGLSSGVMAGL